MNDCVEQQKKCQNTESINETKIDLVKKTKRRVEAL